MGIGFFVLASGLFFRAQARKKMVFHPFLVVFLRFRVVILDFFGDFAFWGVFSRYAAIISRAARKKLVFSPAGP